MYRAEVSIPMGLGSTLIQAVLDAGLYPRLSGLRNGTRRTLGSGWIFGLLARSLTVLSVAATYRTASVADFVMLDRAFTVLHDLVVSPRIALAWRGATEARRPASQRRPTQLPLASSDSLRKPMKRPFSSRCQQGSCRGFSRTVVSILGRFAIALARAAPAPPGCERPGAMPGDRPDRATCESASREVRARFKHRPLHGRVCSPWPSLAAGSPTCM